SLLPIKSRSKFDKRFERLMPLAGERVVRVKIFFVQIPVRRTIHIQSPSLHAKGLRSGLIGCKNKAKRKANHWRLNKEGTHRAPRGSVGFPKKRLEVLIDEGV